MESRNRKEALEQLGIGCWQAWQAKMTAVQALPAMPHSLLHDALPAYRGWLGELAGMSRGWLAVAGDGAGLLDPMLPWHWLGVGHGGVEQGGEAVEALESQRIAEQESPSHLQSLARKSPFQMDRPKSNARPSFWDERRHPQAGKKQAVEMNPPLNLKRSPSPLKSPQQQDGRDDSEREQLQERPKQEHVLWNETIAPETPKQVIFRGLDDFASFVQQPMTIHTVLPDVQEDQLQNLSQDQNSFAQADAEVEKRFGLKGTFEDGGTQEKSTLPRPDGLQGGLKGPQNAPQGPQTKLHPPLGGSVEKSTLHPQPEDSQEKNRAQSPLKIQRKSEARGIGSQERLAAVATIAGNTPAPSAHSVFVQQGLPAWDEVQSVMEQLAVLPHQEKTGPQFQQKTSQKRPAAQASNVEENRGFTEGNPASKEYSAEEGISLDLTPPSLLQHSSIDQPQHVHSAPASKLVRGKEKSIPPLNPRMQMETPTETSPDHRTPAPVAWLGKEKPSSASLHTTTQVEAVLEALTEQLQRDFKRYYGA